MANGGRGKTGVARWAAVAATLLAGAARPAAAATPAEVQAAIDRGKAFLYQAEQGDNWEAVPTPDPDAKGGPSVEGEQYGGLTAIATFALLAAGDDPRQKPQLKKAVDWLLKTPIRGTYALSLRDQVLNAIPMTDAVRQVVNADRDLWLKGVSTKGAARGLFGYGVDTPKDQGDHSTAQFGVLGLWALQQAGAEVPNGAWKLFDDVWHAQQLADGAWSYNSEMGGNVNDEARLSMTAAGVATLYITQEYIHQAPQCKGNIADPGIDKGIEWMAANLDGLNDGRRYYTLFGISRVGLAGGRKYFGQTDWFQLGARIALRDQQPDGSWPGGGETFNSVPNTSFALLFLARGRAPVMMNKLEYDVAVDRPRKGAPAGVPGTWNQRPRDVANVARMASKPIESLLNWQVVSLKDNIADLHDAPILYMAGGTSPKLSAEDVARLRTFCEEGGIVLGNADCGSLPFVDGFHKLGEAMFPGRKFRPVPDDSPIYTAEPYPKTRWKTKLPLEGLNNGAREVMLLMPAGDPGRTWQAEDFKPFKVDALSQMVMDVLFYSVEQDGLRTRGVTYMLTPDPKAKRGPAIKLARIKYAGGWDPEPGGWRRLTTAMHNDGKGELAVTTVDPATPIDPSFKVASLTVGGDAVPLTDGQKANLRAFVDRGGLLLVDVLGGDAANNGYKGAADGAIAAVFPDAPKELAALPGNSPVYADLSPSDIKYRRFARPILGKPTTPLLKGFDKAGKPAVILSREDLSVGLVGQPVDGIVGYAPETATKLVEAIITYGAKR